MKVLDRVKTWVLANKWEFLVFLCIILIALFLRLYRIDQYMTFLGDEGRDMLVMSKIWVEHDLPFIGAPTSVGNMYLGPLYYYMMAIATGIFWLNPVAASVMVALIGTATVGFIYYIGRSWFGTIAGIVASLLYALSPVAITYAKSSWNPNPAPFFALVSLFGIYKVHKSGNMNWLILSAAGLAFLINMHYLALLMIPIIGLLWLYEVVLDYRRKLKRENVWSGTFFAAFVFLLLMSPLVLFDIKHNFTNYQAFMSLFSAKSSAVGGSFWENMMRVWPIYTDKLIGRYISGFDYYLHIITSILVFVPLVWAAVRKIQGGRLRWPYLGLGVYLVVGLFGLTFYKQDIYDHYLGFLSPVPFLLLGVLGYELWGVKNSLVRGLGFIVYGLWFIAVVWHMVVVTSPLLLAPNRQLERTQTIVREVLADSQGKPYNFALIARSNYDSAYQFYLEQYGQKPGQLPFEHTEQLFVVCEDSDCQPINNPKFEIAEFGMSKVEWMKDFEGIKLYKLVANPEGKPE